VGGQLIMVDGGSDAPPDVVMNPCGTECGPEELCDPAHVGTDDNCNGIVDEGCPCSAGQASACFKGDPSYRGAPGCYDGNMSCSENGNWGDCTGGQHAADDPPCFNGDLAGCHPISAVPFETVALKTGTGTFSADAVSEVFSVACPAGVNPCPLVSGLDQYQPLQSGEYTVSYQKTLADNSMETCEFPLFVGAPGLRVELEWEHDLGGDGVDLDFHMHQPSNTSPHSIDGDSTADCGYGNCTIDAWAFGFGSATPEWFPPGNVPPSPVNWFLDPDPQKNLCFFSPRGAGADWQANGQGCHNPRLDIDNISCDPTVQDQDSFDFCAPENINIDFPPKDEWTRISVFYYSNHGETYAVHPNVKIFCNGALSAELGSQGYDSPITFSASDGANGGGGSNKWWMVADVLFPDDQCNNACVVEPVYENAQTNTPWYTTGSNAEGSFGPGYPPVP